MTEQPLPRVAAIVGPTAGGKTAVSVALAPLLHAEILACDSMQIYRRMQIGTAKPTREEMGNVKHHLFDFVDPEATFSAADYVSAAEKVVSDLLLRGKTPLFVGGTGMYLDAFLRGGFSEGVSDPALREKLFLRLREEGGEVLYRELLQIDPEEAEKIHPNNEKRMIRALEICLLTGRKKSELDRISREAPPRYAATVLGLGWTRELLYRRIDERVDFMLKSGLLEETERLEGEGVFRTSKTASQAIGYKELLPYLRGEISLSLAVENLKMATRRYAKRQMTWFTAHGNVIWIEMDDGTRALNFEKIVNNAEKVFREAGFCDIIN